MSVYSALDLSAWTAAIAAAWQRAYAMGLAHFFSWLHHAGEDPDRVTRQIVGSYIAEFARGGMQGAVTARRTHKGRRQVVDPIIFA
jgi:site-specific recombinase XerD